MPAHHEIEETIDEYLARVSIEDKRTSSRCFRASTRPAPRLPGARSNRHNA
jgi:hypothetical protein